MITNLINKVIFQDAKNLFVQWVINILCYPAYWYYVKEGKPYHYKYTLNKYIVFSKVGYSFVISMIWFAIFININIVIGIASLLMSLFFDALLLFHYYIFNFHIKTKQN